MLLLSAFVINNSVFSVRNREVDLYIPNNSLLISVKVFLEFKNYSNCVVTMFLNLDFSWLVQLVILHSKSLIKWKMFLITTVNSSKQNFGPNCKRLLTISGIFISDSRTIFHVHKLVPKEY